MEIITIILQILAAFAAVYAVIVIGTFVWCCINAEPVSESLPKDRQFYNNGVIVYKGENPCAEIAQMPGHICTLPGSSREKMAQMSEVLEQDNSSELPDPSRPQLWDTPSGVAVIVYPNRKYDFFSDALLIWHDGQVGFTSHGRAVEFIANL
jgi:hypothetical protein